MRSDELSLVKLIYDKVTEASSKTPLYICCADKYTDIVLKDKILYHGVIKNTHFSKSVIAFLDNEDSLYIIDKLNGNILVHLNKILSTSKQNMFYDRITMFKVISKENGSELIFIDNKTLEVYIIDNVSDILEYDNCNIVIRLCNKETLFTQIDGISNKTKFNIYNETTKKIMNNYKYINKLEVSKGGVCIANETKNSTQEIAV